MFLKEVLENIKIHLLCCVTFLCMENRTIYEIVWKNVAERGRPQMTIWQMRIACWITKAINTHTGCLILTAFPLQQRLHDRACLLR